MRGTQRWSNGGTSFHDKDIAVNDVVIKSPELFPSKLKDQIMGLGAIPQFKVLATKTIEVPVFHTFMIKHLQHGDEPLSVNICGTFIARQIGYISDMPFPYRFNDTTPTDTQLAFRSMKHATNPCNITASTFAAQVPCKIASIFDQFPFRMVKASAEVTLASRLANEGIDEETGQNQQVKLVPVLQVSLTDERQNMSLKCPWLTKSHRHWYEMTLHQRIQFMSEVYNLDGVKEDFTHGLDQMEEYEVLPIPPSLEYTGENTFQVTFWLEVPAYGALIKVGFPIFLLCILTTINVFSGYHTSMFLHAFEHLGQGDEYGALDRFKKKCNSERENFAEFWGTDGDDTAAEYTCTAFQSAVFFVPVTDYIQTSAALALALILLLPDIQDNRPQVGFTPNTEFITVILLATSLAAVPPHWAVAYGYGPVALIGLVFMWGSVFFPIRSFLKYRTMRSGIVTQYVESIGMDKTNRAPFIQDKDKGGIFKNDHVVNLLPAQPSKDNTCLSEALKQARKSNADGGGACVWHNPKADVGGLKRKKRSALLSRRKTNGDSRSDRLVIGLDPEVVDFSY